MKKAIIIAGYGAIGKTYLGKHYKNVLDLEASKYKYKIDHLSEQEIEHYKGTYDKYRTSNREWPQNYFNKIENELYNYDIILTSMHEEVLDYLKKYHSDFMIAFPTKEAIPEIIERSIKRGNPKAFIDSIKNNINDWYEQLKTNNTNTILWIKPNEYLETILIQKNLLKNKNFHN